MVRPIIKMVNNSQDFENSGSYMVAILKNVEQQFSN